METISIVIIAIFSALILVKLFKNGFSFMTFGGMSTSFSDGTLNVRGNVLSIVLNGKVIYGDTNLKGKNGNSISQSSPDYDFKLMNGHLLASGKIKVIKLNGKKII